MLTLNPMYSSIGGLRPTSKPRVGSVDPLAAASRLRKRAVRRASAKRIDLITEDSQAGIGPQVRGDLLCAGLIDADLSGSQSGVRRLELVTDLLPRQRLLGKTDLSQGNNKEQPD